MHVEIRMEENIMVCGEYIFDGLICKFHVAQITKK